MFDTSFSHRSRAPQWLVIYAICCAPLLSVRAAANELTATLQFFSKAPQCGDETSFRRAIKKRDGRIKWSSEARLRLTIRITAQSERMYRGLLSVADGKGATGTREVNGQCHEVMDALALFATMAVHARQPKAPPPTAPRDSSPSTPPAPPPPKTTEAPDSAEVPKPPTDAEPPSAPANKATAGPAKPKDKAETKPKDKAETKPKDKAKTKPKDKAKTKPKDKAKTKPKDKAKTKPIDKAETKPKDKAENKSEALAPAPNDKEGAERTAARLSTPHRNPEGWRWGLGAYAGAANSLGSDLSVFFPVFLTLEKHSPQLFSPAFRIGVNLGLPTTQALSTGEAKLTRITAKVQGCPLRLRWLQRWSLLPCAGIEAGGIIAESSGLDENADATSAWLAADGTLRLGFDFTSWLSAQVQGGVGGALLRPRYLVTGATTDESLELSSVYGTFSGGIHMQFP